MEITTDEQDVLQNFATWVETTNSRTSDLWAEKQKDDLSPEESDIVGSLVDIEE